MRQLAPHLSRPVRKKKKDRENYRKMWKRTIRPDLIDWEYVVREKFVIRFTKNRVYALDGATMATIAGSMVGVVLRTVGQQRPMRRGGEG